MARASALLAAAIREHRDFSVSTVEVNGFESHFHFIVLQLDVLNFSQFVTHTCGREKPLRISLSGFFCYT